MEKPKKGRLIVARFFFRP